MNVVSKITLSQVHFKFFVKCINRHIVVVVVGDVVNEMSNMRNEMDENQEAG